MKYELINNTNQGTIVIPFKYFHEVWNFQVRHPGNYTFLVDGVLTDLKDYVLDNMLVPRYRFK